MSAEPFHAPETSEDTARRDAFVTAFFSNTCFSFGNTPPIAQGSERKIYPVAGVPSLIVKVRSEVAKKPKKKRIKWVARLKQNLLPERSRQLHELTYYAKLKLKEAAIGRPAPVANMFGFIDTDLGQGLVCEAIRQQDGQLAPTLEHFIESPKDLSSVMDMLNEFVAEAYAWNIVVYDLTAKNLVLASNGKPRFVLVDGLGHRGYIAYKAAMPSANARNLDRRFAAMTVPAGYEWDSKKRRFAALT